jgi:hypothetical protein
VRRRRRALDATAEAGTLERRGRRLAYAAGVHDEWTCKIRCYYSAGPVRARRAGFPKPEPGARRAGRRAAGAPLGSLVAERVIDPGIPELFVTIDAPSVSYAVRTRRKPGTPGCSASR